MKYLNRFLIPLLLVLLLLVGAVPAGAAINSQCPQNPPGGALVDLDGDGMFRAVDGEIPNAKYPTQVCKHVSSGDGFVTMGDGRPMYIFSYSDVTGIPDDEVMEVGTLSHTVPAPIITLDQDDQFFLNLSNVGMAIRPDLFDPHTIHYHGFPEASSIFDGVPDSSVSINMGTTLTYYYNVVEAGTYIYHCHVEATEHMQMGMIGNLYVRPRQNKLADGTVLGSHIHSNPDFGSGDDPLVGDKYVYNDGDGSTAYDVELALQLVAFDSAFHDASETVQPLPFALMRDDYALFNGRGYPDTVNPNPLPAPAEAEPVPGGPESTQLETSLIEANVGDRVLLRLSSVSITRPYTIKVLGIPMRVVGKDAKLLRGPDGKDLSYSTGEVIIGPGENYDVILDTAGVAPGTYFLYVADLNYLSNGASPGAGGAMTEIVLN
jgi:FtsP/CotA-like multicopper oxidase with cupredoxin domain